MGTCRLTVPPEACALVDSSAAHWDGAAQGVHDAGKVSHQALQLPLRLRTLAVPALGALVSLGDLPAQLRAQHLQAFICTHVPLPAGTLNVAIGCCCLVAQ